MTIVNARANWQCSLAFITFCAILSKISEIMGSIMKSKASVKTEFVNRQIANRQRFMETINVN
jgi:hypothetical protein